MTLSALYQLTGALYTFKGDDLQAKAAFEWAFSVAPTQPLDPHLGLKSERAFRAVHDELIQRPTGSVILLGEGDSWIDGRKVPTRERLELSSGPHLLQWRGDGESLQSRDIRLNPGDSLEISLQRSNQAVAATVPSTKEEAPQSGRAAPATQSNSMSLKPMTLAGGALVAASTGLLVAAKQAHSLFDDNDYWRETFPGEEVPKAVLERQQSKTNLLYSSGLGAGALGVGLLGAGVLLGEDSALLSVHGTW